jgi:hypothetical protein
MPRLARSLEDCLLADNGLARLSAHARRLLRLQRVFLSATPLSLQSRIANLRSGRIVIHARNSAVAAKLRQIEPRLTDVFRSEAAEVTGIDIRVQPSRPTEQGPTHHRQAGIGPKQKRALTSLAGSLPEGSPLGAALRKLVDQT